MAEWIFLSLGFTAALLFIVRPDIIKEINAAIKIIPSEQKFWRDVNPVFVRVTGVFTFGAFCVVAYQMAQRALSMAR